jgi:hypothetical protein
MPPSRGVLSVTERVVFGAIGALLPIFTNVLVVDLALTFTDLTPSAAVGFICRVVVLIFFGGLVGYANGKEHSVWKLLQLGAAAPALLVAIVNGHQFKEGQTRNQAPLQHETQVGFSLVAPVYAFEPSAPSSDPDGPSLREFWRGFLGAPRTVEFTRRWVGIYTVDATKEVANPLGPGSRWISTDWRVISETTRIPAALGVRFGVGFVLHGPPKDSSINYRVVWKFPAGGMTNPEIGKTWLSATFDRSCRADAECFQGWPLQFPWQIVPGAWVLELWDRQTLLYSQTFDVLRP